MDGEDMAEDRGLRSCKGGSSRRTVTGRPSIILQHPHESHEKQLVLLTLVGLIPARKILTKKKVCQWGCEGKRETAKHLLRIFQGS